MKMKRAFFSLLSVFVCSASIVSADPDPNVEKMRKAALSLELSLPENRVFFLVKRETIRSVVGVIFGYVDNEAACDELATALSSAGTVGTFLCEQVR
ncbi:hypothetical protein MN188_16940 [Aliiroseovarius sp. N1Y82]|nr:hypothetical protein [Aliiroseovarius subalbicans]MCI2401083.1 hypothetical protein [Aliiroseovarius subalbicans]